MITIVERGSSHILTQNKILQEEYKRFNKEFSINPSLIKQELKEYEEADYIAVPSYFVKDSFIAQGMPEERLFMNPYGANASFYSRLSLIKADNIFRIVYLGTLSIRKGLIYFFEAIKQLRIPPKAFEVLLIGSIAPEMEEMVEKYKQDNWRIIGHIDHYQLPAILGTCDIGVQPSLEEGLSMVIPQMMACGVPVIVTPNTGGQNIIDDGKNGFVVPIRDPQAIADKLQWAYNHPDDLQEMKKNVAESIVKDFTWESYGKRYSEFLKLITGKKVVIPS